jgi:hypothetical protein
MGKRSNSLHFNCVTLIERVIQNTGCVYNLPLCVLVLTVTNEQILGCKGIRLNIHVCIGYVVDERRFTNIRETSHNQCSCISIDLG